VAPSVRRALLAWLVSHDAVERVRIVLGSPHPGLTIEVNVARLHLRPAAAGHGPPIRPPEGGFA